MLWCFHVEHGPVELFTHDLRSPFQSIHSTFLWCLGKEEVKEVVSLLHQIKKEGKGVIRHRH